MSVNVNGQCQHWLKQWSVKYRRGSQRRNRELTQLCHDLILKYRCIPSVCVARHQSVWLGSRSWVPTSLSAYQHYRVWGKSSSSVWYLNNVFDQKNNVCWKNSNNLLLKQFRKSRPNSTVGNINEHDNSHYIATHELVKDPRMGASVESRISSCICLFPEWFLLYTCFTWLLHWSMW